MKLLSTPRELSRTLSGLIRDYDSFYWSVAWASVGFEGYECLKKNSRKARMIVVGTHFYQTHPDFIKQFSGNRAFRYFYDTDAINGVFHPKIFVFTKANGEAAAIVGSANFTGAALGKNVEVCLLIQGEERPSKVLQSLKRY